MSISWSISLNDLLARYGHHLTHLPLKWSEYGVRKRHAKYLLLTSAILFPLSRTVKHGMTQKLNSDSRETIPIHCSLRAEGYFLYISPRDNISNSSSQWTKTLMNLYFTCSNRNRFGRIFEHISVGWDMIFHPICHVRGLQLHSVISSFSGILPIQASTWGDTLDLTILPFQS